MLERLQRHWDEFGRRDPYWAILTDPAKQGNRWELDEFFATGQAEIAQVLDWAAGHGLTVRHGRAFDFGCGVGRLTQALAERFDVVTGVDIAPSMLQLADRHNRHGARCRYVLNDREDLRQFPSGSCDFIYSRLVLQHMRPRSIRSYLREFVRLLDSGGIAIFNLPVSPLDAPVTGALKARLPWWLVRGYRRARLELNDRLRFPNMEVNGLARDEVAAIVDACGATVTVAEPDQTHGDAGPGFLYAVLCGRSDDQGYDHLPLRQRTGRGREETTVGTSSDIIRSVYEAFAKGDVPAVLGAFDPQIQWREAESFLYADGNPYVGPGAVAEGVFMRIGADLDGFAVVPESFVDGGDTVVALGRYGGTMKATGKAVDAQFAHVWQVKDGRIVRFQQYTDTKQWADAAGR